MTAQIMELATYRACHPRPVVRVRIVYDPLWPLRLWLACCWAAVAQPSLSAFSWPCPSCLPRSPWL
ncbi:MAG: hypothetical protein EKK49_07465 [Rhodocyclaceae bacterium]|nr:MAG: hypothetical protein EKK49_07465 [Rhodocyclaceae bacterium]